MDMLKKIISFTLTFLIIIYMAVPTYANNNWVNCNVDDEGKVTLEWNSEFGISELRIIRSGVIFKSFTVNVPNSGSFSFTETKEGIFDYEVRIYGSIGWMDNILFAKTEQKISVKGTGKPKIWLDFVNAYTNDPNNTVYYPPVARVKNWVNIKNIGTTDLELSKLMIRYFYTIDGEPSTVKYTFPNNGQQKAEESDGKINPTEPYTEYAVGRKDIQEKSSIRMNFLKIPFNVTNENNQVVADYICETYFEGTTEKIDSAYYLRLQPAFDKKNLSSIESNHEIIDTYIRNYDLSNDFSFNNNQNIAVYYDGEKIWGLDPTVIAPKNLTGNYINYKIELDWDDSPGASGYTVYKSESRDGEFRKIAVNIDRTNYTDTDVEMPNQSVGKKYYYKVVAHYNKIFSDDSNIVEVEVSELKAPTNLTASVIDGKNVKLEWDESLGATKYNVYRSESQNGVYSKIKSDVTETNFIDYTAEPQGLKKTYYYKIKAAIENSGSTIESEFSDFAAATIINLPIPTNLTAKLINTKNVELNWSDAKGAAGYTIYRSDSENGEYKPIKTVSVNTYVDESITLIHDFKDYYYKVSAIYNIDGSIIHSAKSDNVSLTMPRKKLEAPDNLKAVQYGTQVLLDWTPSVGAKKYIISRSEYKNSGFISIATIDAIKNNGDLVTSYLDTTVPEVTDSVGKNFYYKMVATYDDGDDPSEDSDVASVMIKVFIGGDTQYWSWYCSIKSINSDFVLGTYIPVSFTITMKEDVDKLSLFLKEDLINNKNSKNLNTYLVSKAYGDVTKNKLIEVKLNTNTNIGDDVKIEDTIIMNKYTNDKFRDIIRIDGPFKKDDVIVINFVIKTSANDEVIKEGINKYYGDNYDLDFDIGAEKKGVPDITERAVTESGKSLNINIQKPDKLQ